MRVNIEAERARMGYTKQQMCNALGITLKTYNKQGTKKEEAMAYINKQNLTKAQKDALYLCKYAESKINEAPWR